MNRTPISSSELRKLFQKDFPEIYELAKSNDFKGFHSELNRILKSSIQKPSSKFLLLLAEREGSVVHDLPSGTDVTLSTLSYLFHFFNGAYHSEGFLDGALDIYATLHAVDKETRHPSRRIVLCWMARWPKGTDSTVLRHRAANKELRTTLLYATLSGFYNLRKLNCLIKKIISIWKRRKLQNSWCRPCWLSCRLSPRPLG